MSTSPVAPREGRPGAETHESSAALADRAYGRAWLSLLLFLLSLTLTLAVFVAIWAAADYTTIWAVEYPAGESSPAGWSARGIWVLLTLLYVWPLLVVVRFARKARALGRPEWLGPVIVGATLAALPPVLNLGLLIG